MQYDNRWQEIVGLKLKAFCLNKWSTQKKAAVMLDIAESTLSQFFSGARKPSALQQRKFVKLGFEQAWFDVYYELDKLFPEQLTEAQIKELIINQQFLIKQQANFISWLTKSLEKQHTRAEEIEKWYIDFLKNNNL